MIPPATGTVDALWCPGSGLELLALKGNGRARIHVDILDSPRGQLLAEGLGIGRQNRKCAVVMRDRELRLDTGGGARRHCGLHPEMSPDIYQCHIRRVLLAD